MHSSLNKYPLICFWLLQQQSVVQHTSNLRWLGILSKHNCLYLSGQKPKLYYRDQMEWHPAFHLPAQSHSQPDKFPYRYPLLIQYFVSVSNWSLQMNLNFHLQCIPQSQQTQHLSTINIEMQRKAQGFQHRFHAYRRFPSPKQQLSKPHSQSQVIP